MVNKKNEENKIKYSCPLCLKEFGNKKDNYQKHLNKTGCGAGITKLEEMKKQIEEIKQQHEEIKIHNDIDILRLKEENEKLVEEDKKLKEENKKLKEENENLKNQTIIYNNCNNTYNNFILQINNFDDTKCEVIIQNLLKYMGKSIYLKTVEDIYLNNTTNHNIYVADKNRQIVKIFNNGIWQSKNMIIIDKIIDNIVKQFNLSVKEIKKDKEKYERLKERITNKKTSLYYFIE